MNLIDLSIKRTVFAWMLMFTLIVFGAICLNRLGTSQLPDVDFPVLTVSVSYPGAAPEVIEADLLDPIEEQLLQIEGIKEMRASASQGSGRVSLEFEINRNVDVALQEVQAALSQMRMPPNVDPPVIRKQNPEESPIMFLSIYGGDLREMVAWTESFLINQLRFISGVGEVDIGGFSQRNLRIWVDMDRLRVYDLTLTDVVDAVNTQHAESAAGQFVEGAKEFRLRWLGEATELKEVENIRILRRGGGMIFDRNIRVKDVARVEDGLSDVRRLARVDGKPAIALSIRKQRRTNEVEIAKSVRAKLLELKDQFPAGYEYRVNVDFTSSTEATVNLTVEKLWVAALITILVCFLFLGSIPAAVNILFSIPVSIVGTFIILYFSGFTLNLFTLLALTLAISIVVDDAIMLLENIVRHYRMGKGADRAASEGAKEVLPAATAATLAVIAVFLPVVFMDGVIGKFFFQFGVTLCAAVSLSLLEAVTITPMRSATFLRSEPKINRFERFLDEWFERFAHSYQNALKFTLRWGKSVVVVSLVLFALSLVSIKALRQEFVPAQDQDLILMSAQAAPGTTLEVTSEMIKQVEEILKNERTIEGFFTSVGGGPGANSVNQVFIPITLVPKDKREEKHTEIMDRLRAKTKEVKGIRVTMRDNSGRGLSAGRINPVAFNVRGGDLEILDQKSKEIIKRLTDEKLAVELDTDFRQGLPELLITPNRNQMAVRGVSIESVGNLLSASVGGLRSGRYTFDGRRYDIRFKMREDQIRSREDLKRIYVRNNAGNMIPLVELVDIKESKATQAIYRVNRQRSISVFGNLAPGQSQAVVLNRAQAIAKEVLPVGYAFSLEGASAGFSQSFQSLGMALLIGILTAYIILAVQFNSFVHPISVLVALPFSLTGAFLALWAFGLSLNLFSFIGIIVLMGIAKKNSIMLVEFTNQKREQGMSLKDALLEACPIRLRPILMTSVATVAAAGPLVFGGGMGAETRAPMGLVIIGGTIVSTVFTLFVVPALYQMLAWFEAKKRVSGLDSPDPRLNAVPSHGGGAAKHVATQSQES